MSSDPGIGIDAAKVVSECIHSSRVKEMGVSLLKKNANVEEEDDDFIQSYDRLSEEEIKKYQLKLARSLVVFMELLHLLIARNRDLLLDVIQTRKKQDPGSTRNNGRETSLGSFNTLGRAMSAMSREISIPGTLPSSGGERSRHDPLPSSGGERTRHEPRHERRGSAAAESTSSDGGRSREEYSSASHSKRRSDGEEYSGAYSSGTMGSFKDPGTERFRTDSAIGIQRELQLAFISLAKDLYPMIHGILESDTPRWLKQCCQDNYFSAYTYRQTKIRKLNRMFCLLSFLNYT
jgi:hypothetical protein